MWLQFVQEGHAYFLLPSFCILRQSPCILGWSQTHCVADVILNNFKTCYFCPPSPELRTEPRTYWAKPHLLLFCLFYLFIFLTSDSPHFYLLKGKSPGSFSPEDGPRPQPGRQALSYILSLTILFPKSQNTVENSKHCWNGLGWSRSCTVTVLCQMQVTSRGKLNWQRRLDSKEYADDVAWEMHRWETTVGDIRGIRAASCLMIRDALVCFSRTDHS